MRDVVIVSAVRTALGSFGGSLKDIAAPELGATVIKEANLLLQNEESYNKMSKAINPYGDGVASKRIADAILKYYELSDKEVEEFKR